MGLVARMGQDVKCILNFNHTIRHEESKRDLSLDARMCVMTIKYIVEIRMCTGFAGLRTR
jgi:hypothetical protein